MEQLIAIIQTHLNQNLQGIIISNPRRKEGYTKVKVRPVALKGELLYQFSCYTEKQVQHRNLTGQQALEEIQTLCSSEGEKQFGQLELDSPEVHVTALISKKGKVTIKQRKKTEAAPVRINLSHNRAKKYLLEEGKVVPFLQDLGVQTADGKIVHSRYDKFRQINRFLEFVEDVVPALPKDRTVRILDFGCGKSYLTFAVYYYLHELRGLEVEITGLDLKQDVIRHCNELAVRYGYTNLQFYCGDIADYAGKGKIDMVMTLHACDTATDFALYQAIKWEAGVILSVPCCQHEVNNQIHCEALEGALRYGLIKERLSALFTDALRADLLEEHGYETQVLEFIDMEHTPKNILLRAVRRPDGEKAAKSESRILAETLGIHTTLQKLLESRETD